MTVTLRPMPNQPSFDSIDRYFNTNKYASFQRQLNLYKFLRIGKGSDEGEVIITHGKAMCTNVYYKDVIEAIDFAAADPAITSLVMLLKRPINQNRYQHFHSIDNLKEQYESFW